ncbi:hypothetical protein ACFSJU_14815 [Paradesertivirga mongoliensis]|uniref:Uncharacterized protein n=1 Tax=Paradesertivirga mongoliensis TaxID=2100740 RepID=A0ABW4ZP64_9SPHI|nr:hypothetical protein [Pedobacter mongoliensis]
MQDINAWLHSERDFTKGAELYQKYGTNSFFRTLLKAGPTPYNVKKLGEELEGLAPGTPASVEAQAERLKVKGEGEAPKEEVKVNIRINGKQKSAISETQRAADMRKYLALKAERDKILLQIDNNKFLLNYESNQVVLHQTAKQLLKLWDKKQELWMLIDYYDEHGCFEVVEVVPEKSREEKMQLIYQCISRANSRLKKPGYKDREKTLKLIEEKRKELEVLKGGEG